MKTVFTARTSSNHKKKNLLFLNLIKRLKSTSRAELSRLTGVNIVSVSNYINNYLKKGLVVEHGYDLSSGGRRPELVGLNQHWGHVIGIDMGKNSTRGVLANFGMEILSSESIQGSNEKDKGFLINEILKKLLRSSNTNKEQVKMIGISAVSLSILEDFIKAKDSIEEQTNIPLVAGNNALCAAFGEKDLNPHAQEASRLLYLFTELGEGVFIEDDEFYEAQNGENKSGSGDLNLRYLKPWRQNFSIVNEAKRIVARGVGTRIVDITGSKIEDITTAAVIKAAKERDETAIELIRMAAMNLSVRIAYLINLLKPEIVIIGGGIEKAGGIFLEPLTSNINRFKSHKAVNKVRLAPGTLGEEASAKGASSLARRELFIEG